MLNTEIREYVSQMNQEELEELKEQIETSIRESNNIEQYSLERRLRRAVRLVATNQQCECINTERNFVINKFERATGKTVGIVLEMLYNMEDCKIKGVNREYYKTFQSTVYEIVDFIKNNLRDYETLKAEIFLINREDFSFEITYGNKIFRIYNFDYAKNVNTLYCDDCLPFTTVGKFNKVRAYITDDNVFKLLNQCHKNIFTTTIDEHHEEIKNKGWRCSC